MDQQQSTSIQTKPVESKPTKPGSSKTVIVIIIILVVLLVVGVGGYFTWRNFGQKLINRITGKTIETTTNDGKIKIQSVFDALMYPGSTITDQKLGESSTIYVAEMTLSSSADAATIKNYYVKLINDNNWKITRQGTSSDENYYLNFESSDFTAELDITRYPNFDTTDIRIGIDGDKLSDDGISISTVPTTNSETSNTSATGTTSPNSSDYIISDSNTREISRSELINLTSWQLKVARNEIYARHGRPFVHKDLQCYFAKKNWYKVDNSYDVSSVTYIENKNIATIQAYEQEINSPLQSTDSSCNTNN